MAIIITRNRITPEDIKKAREDYKNYIKLTVDIDKQVIALGGEFHADAEKLLLEQGSKQKDLWGGGFDLTLKLLETKAVINIRGGINDSTDILDPNVRNRFLKIAKNILRNYV